MINYPLLRLKDKLDEPLVRASPPLPRLATSISIWPIASPDNQRVCWSFHLQVHGLLLYGLGSSSGPDQTTNLEL